MEQVLQVLGFSLSTKEDSAETGVNAHTGKSLEDAKLAPENNKFNLESAFGYGASRRRRDTLRRSLTIPAFALLASISMAFPLSAQTVPDDPVVLPEPWRHADQVTYTGSTTVLDNDSCQPLNATTIQYASDGFIDNEFSFCPPATTPPGFVIEMHFDDPNTDEFYESFVVWANSGNEARDGELREFDLTVYYQDASGTPQSFSQTGINIGDTLNWNDPKRVFFADIGGPAVITGITRIEMTNLVGGVSPPFDDPSHLTTNFRELVVAAPDPEIAVVKSAVLNDGGDGWADAGDTITYTYIVTNTGAPTLFDVSIVEDAGTFTGTNPTPVPAFVSGGADLDSGGVNNDLRAGETVTFEATYTLTAADISAGQISNQARANGTDFHGVPVSDASGTANDNDVPTVVSLPANPVPPGLDPGQLNVNGCVYVHNMDGLPPYYNSHPVYALGRNDLQNGQHITHYEWNGNIGIPSDASGSGKFIMHNTVQAAVGEVFGVALTPSVQPNTDYRLRFKTAANNNINPAYIEPRINGVPIGAPVWVNSVYVWTTHDYIWNSGANTTAAISLWDHQSASNGHDYGIDEISLCPVNSASLNVGMGASVGVMQADGTFDVTYTIVVTNDGSIALDGLTLANDLSLGSNLGSALNGVVAGPVVTGAGSAGSSAPTANTSFDGTSGNSNLLTGAANALAPGDSFTVTFTVNVDAGAVPPLTTTLNNLATATGDPVNGSPTVTDVSDTDTTPAGGVDLTPNEPIELIGVPTVCSLPRGPNAVDDSDTGTLGSSVTLSILNNDTGGYPPVADTVNLIVPAGVTTSSPVSVDGDLVGFVVDDEGTWSYDDGTGELTFTPAPDFLGDPTPITYQVEDADGDFSNAATVTIDYPEPAPSLQLTKSAAFDDGGDGADVGDTVTYSYRIENTGNVTLTNVVLTDALLGMTDVAVTDAATFTTPAASATLSAGEVLNLTISTPYVLVQADLDAGGVENTATVTGTPPAGPNVSDVSDTADGSEASNDPDLGEPGDQNGTDDDDNDATNDPTVVAFPTTAALQLTKSASFDDGGDGADIGDAITYSFRVENTGNVTLTDVTLTDTLLGLSDVAITDTGTFGPAAASATMAPGDVVTLTATQPYALTQDDLDAGGVENTASVSGSTPAGADVSDVSDTADGSESTQDPDLGAGDPNGTDDDDNDATNDPTVVTFPTTVALQLTKSASFDDGGDGADIGDAITYSFQVENTGNVTLTEVTLTDALLGLSDVAITDTGTFGPAAASATMAPGDVVTLTATQPYALTQADLGAGGVENTATVTASQRFGPDVFDVSDTADGSETTNDPDLGEPGDPNGAEDDDDDPTNDPTVVRLSPLDMIDQELLELLEDDLEATMTQQRNRMRKYADGALQRLRSRDSESCRQAVNGLLEQESILFDTNKNTILPESEPVLDRMAEVLGSCASSRFEIAGHTDSRASDEYNLRLSQARAEAVLVALRERGVETEGFVARGYGEQNPIASNATAEGMARNRRVEFLPSAVEDDAARRCKDASDTQRNAELTATDTGINFNGGFRSERRTCANDSWAIVEGSASYLSYADGLSQTMVDLSYRRESFTDDDSVAGLFVGMYGSQSDVTTLADGTITGLGINAGVYGANRFDNGLFLDYYLGAALGRHKFDLDFERGGGVINADGHYTYLAGFAGAAVSGETTVGGVAVMPGAGLDFAYSPGGTVSVTAASAVLSETGDLSIGPVHGGRGYAKLRFEPVMEDSNATLGITPRIACTLEIGNSEGSCGYGGTIDLSGQLDSGDFSYSISLDAEHFGTYTSGSLSVGYQWSIWGGSLNGTVDVSRSGGLTLGQAFEMRF